MADWAIKGESKSAGEECGFHVTINEDGTGRIAAWMEYAAEEAQLTLTNEQVAGLRDTVSQEERSLTKREWLEDVVCFAYQADRISEGQASRLLNVDRLTFRKIRNDWIMANDPPVVER